MSKILVLGVRAAWSLWLPMVCVAACAYPSTVGSRATGVSAPNGMTHHPMSMERVEREPSVLAVHTWSTNRREWSGVRPSRVAASHDKRIRDVQTAVTGGRQHLLLDKRGALWRWGSRTPC